MSDMRMVEMAIAHGQAGLNQMDSDDSRQWEDKTRRKVKHNAFCHRIRF